MIQDNRPWSRRQRAHINWAAEFRTCCSGANVAAWPAQHYSSRAWRLL